MGNQSLISSWSLEGKTALVCGSSGGIGEAAARLFAERGARVIALARSADKLEKIIASLPGSGHKFITVDLSDTDAIKNHVIPQISKEIVHILVNNTGGPKGGPLYKTDISEFETPVRARLVLLVVFLVGALDVKVVKAQDSNPYVPLNAALDGWYSFDFTDPSLLTGVSDHETTFGKNLRYRDIVFHRDRMVYF